MEAFLSSLTTVAIAEIGDKTQLLSLLLTVRFKNNLAIVAGILFATLLNHAFSAWAGIWLSAWLTPGLSNGLFAGAFIIVGLWLLIPDKEEAVTSSFDRYGAFLATSVLFFLAEMGDKTQIATVLLAGEYQHLGWVTLGTTLGMMAANVPVVYFGEPLVKALPMKQVRLAASICFVLLGVYWLFRM